MKEVVKEEIQKQEEIQQLIRKRSQENLDIQSSTIVTQDDSNIQVSCQKNQAMEIKDTEIIPYIWYHVRSSDSSPQHHLYPIGESSWCKYKKAEVTGTLDDFHHSKNLPEAVCDEIKPVFVKMSSLKLLKRCLGGHTQNANKSFNNISWKLCPKTVHVGHKTIKLAANVSTVIFNYGMAGFLFIMKELDINPGLNAIKAAKKKDQERLYVSGKKQVRIVKHYE